MTPGPNGFPTGFENAALIGQPFTITKIRVPMDLELTCNCVAGEPTTITILGSVPAACPHCRKLYNALFNPATGKVEMQIAAPGEKAPS